MASRVPTEYDLDRRLQQPNPVTKAPEVKRAVQRGKWKVVANTFNLRVSPPPSNALITIAGEFITQIQDDYITSIE